MGVCGGVDNIYFVFDDVILFIVYMAVLLLEFVWACLVVFTGLGGGRFVTLLIAFCFDL